MQSLGNTIIISIANDVLKCYFTSLSFSKIFSTTSLYFLCRRSTTASCSLVVVIKHLMIFFVFVVYLIFSVCRPSLCSRSVFVHTLMCLHRCRTSQLAPAPTMFYIVFAHQNTRHCKVIGRGRSIFEFVEHMQTSRCKQTN